MRLVGTDGAEIPEEAPQLAFAGNLVRDRVDLVTAPLVTKSRGRRATRQFEQVAGDQQVDVILLVLGIERAIREQEFTLGLRGEIVAQQGLVQRRCEQGDRHAVVAVGDAVTAVGDGDGGDVAPSS